MIAFLDYIPKDIPCLFCGQRDCDKLDVLGVYHAKCGTDETVENERKRIKFPRLDFSKPSRG